MDIARSLLLLHGMNLKEQLRTRRIEYIHIQPLLVMGMLGRYRGAFLMFLDEDLFSKGMFEEVMFTFAHELGHTFYITEKGSYETGADAFARIWLGIGTNRQQLNQFLANVKEKRSKVPVRI